jgi:hypothetical protein
MIHRGYEKFVTPFPVTARQAAEFLFSRQVQAHFIYLNAGHEAEDVYEDLAGFWKVLRRDGILMGDNYEPNIWPALARAVQRFGDEIGQPPVICGDQDALQFVFQKKPPH